MTDQDRITKLEIKMTYLEDYIEKLNKVIIEHENKISSLSKELLKLKIQFEATTETIEAKEKPPHY